MKFIFLSLIFVGLSASAGELNEVFLNTPSTIPIVNKVIKCAAKRASDALGSDFKFTAYSGSAVRSGTNRMVAGQWLIYKVKGGLFHTYSVNMTSTNKYRWQTIDTESGPLLYSDTVDSDATISLAAEGSPILMHVDLNGCDQ